MTKQKSKKKHPSRSGLILLIVLGMLAMFTLLAVTYVVSAGASHDGSRALAVKARRSSLSVDGFAKVVLKDAIRGTNNQKSAFFGNSLMGDIFGPNPIRTSFGPYANANAVRFFDQRTSGLSLVKLSINEMIGGAIGLSPYENEYNSRIMTVLEGPLAGQSFRILKYVGYANNGTGADPNITASAWADPTTIQADGNDIRYSILIDLNEVKGAEFTGEYTDSDGVAKSKTISIDRWIAEEGIASLFYFKKTAAGIAPTEPAMVGYKLLINDAAFNSPGIGLEDVAEANGSFTDGFGNLDGRRLLATSRKIPLSLLTHYDYLQDRNLMVQTTPTTWGVDGLGNMQREWTGSPPQLSLKGWSNEGYDVADFHDAWLANQSFSGGQLTITPSYHRPEVINYLSHLYGNPSSLSRGEVMEMLRLIDASTARILSYPGKNEGFAQNDPRTVRMPINFPWSTPPTIPEINTLRAFVRHQITGALPSGALNEWDVDNNGDSFKDSVWVETGLAAVNSPDGRRLRPLAAILIEDLDSRVNLNTSGDRVQGGSGFNVTSTGYYKRASQSIAQGFGYGPAEISLTHLFQNAPPSPGFPLLYSSMTSFSFFDNLAGARRYKFRPINFPSVQDRVPGIPRPLTYPDSSYSSLSEREFHEPTQHNRLPGMPISRRGTFGMSYDRNGNPIFVNPPIVDANPYNALVADFANETLNDRYESAAMGTPISDDPLGLAELEAVLRRFDEDASSLPQRLREVLNPLAGSGLLDSIYNEVTTRSGELRYPNIAAAMKVSPLVVPPLPTAPFYSTLQVLGNEGVPTGKVTDVSVPSYLRYIQMLHSQRYRVRSFPPATTDDPEISYAALSELFPTDFARGLKMDLNRPFGNGFDDDGDGQVDEPQEVTSDMEYNGTSFTDSGYYIREMKTDARKVNATVVETNANANPFTSIQRFQIGSRQILARNLYCLAQLIIPRDYEFPGMDVEPTALGRARIRATAIAQWAVNVVDFRDADGAMTRFEFDILPFGSNTSALANFGSGTPGGLPVKPASWAPDRVQHGGKPFCGVVWGMEMPELLLTETLAIHDTRIRDTDMEAAMGNIATAETDPTPDFDQFRLPQASLFVEIYNPRTTDVATNALIPGVPSSLYDTTSMRLDLDRMAPASATWGSQPVWRIAISEAYTTTTLPNHPQSRLTSADPDIRKAFQTITHQRTTEGVPGGTTPNNALTGASDLDHINTALVNIEQYIGNDLRHDLSDTTRPPDSVDPVGFERFIWFTGTRPGATQPIPDILPAIRTAGLTPTYLGVEQASVYSAQSAGASLAGGSYMVIGPRSQTNFGSLSHNQFTGYEYGGTTRQTLRSAMTTPGNRPQLSPSYQRIDLTGGAFPTVNTYMLNNEVANLPFMGRIKPPEVMICSTTAPGAWIPAFPGPAGSPAFATTGAIGLNISYPRRDLNPVYWDAGRVPTERLNSADVAGGTIRPDGTPGFGTMDLPEDSWADLGVDPVVGAFPDTPYDMDNPLLTTTGMPPATDEILRQTRTLPNVRAAYLQRLADPEFAYDPVSNPYITVDWMSIDLTVFNGEAPRDTSGAGSPVQMQARYKNGELSPLAVTTMMPNPHAVDNKGVSYYSPVTGALRPTFEQTTPATITVPGITAPVNPDAYCHYQLGFDRASVWGSAVGSSATTLGYCNVGYPTTPPATPAVTDAVLATANWAAFDGFGPPINDPTAINAFRGSPARIAGATWFNRPFASPYEIMMVPLTGPGQFGFYHSAYTSVQQREDGGFIPSFQTSNAWNVALSTILPVGAPESLQSYWAKPQAILGLEKRLADWPLLLDFLETQPGFIDANQHYNASAVASFFPPFPSDSLSERFLNSFIPSGYTRPRSNIPTDLDNSEPSTVRGPSLLAPFHLKPSYVAAGKINLNTISFDSMGHSRALRALEYNYLAGERTNLFNSTIEDQFVTSRQGYTTASVPSNAFFGAVVHPAMHPNFPTRVVGAFRPAMSSNIAPTLADADANAKMRSRFGVESTLLRSLSPELNLADAGTRQSQAADTELLFQSTTVTATAPDSDPDILNAKHNFVRMQRAMRLPNLVTNQSNVFAVWVTVSLFEYDPITGYGNEYLGDDGLPKRERQFFIVDRTIPVGFKPGEDLNTDRTILLQRKLR